MSNISGLSEGIVLNRIKADKSLDIYYRLGFSKLDSQIAIIKNIYPQKMGRRDIIEVEGGMLGHTDLNVLDYIDHSITVNIIRNSKIIGKRVPRLPKQITNAVHYKNPHCITSIERELPHIFYLSNPEREIYRCHYCDEHYTNKTR